jgi:hypothetical protein
MSDEGGEDLEVDRRLEEILLEQQRYQQLVRQRCLLEGDEASEIENRASGLAGVGVDASAAVGEAGRDLEAVVPPRRVWLEC